MRYVCIRDCYYNRRLYTAGEVVEFKWEAPKHFAPLDGGQSPAKEQGGESSPAKTAAKTAAKTTSDKK